MCPYLFLIVFVILLPLLVVDSLGYGSVWFCKYICPAGTLEAGIPLLSMDQGLRSAAGWLFTYKFVILILLLIWCTLTSRPFCRAICPLGAIYGLFNRASWLQLRFHPDQCVQCEACLTACPTDVSFYNGLDDLSSVACIRCLRCYTVCPSNAISLEFGPVREDIGKAVNTIESRVI
jgi:ferredoxin-type protein NapH